ncbi:endoplasmic reticulum retention protein, partial [Ceratobasidium sp. 414]
LAHAQEKTADVHPGISFKTQALYVAVFLTRYIDLFTFHFVSVYNTFMKIFFIASSVYILYLMKFKYRPTSDPSIDTFELMYLVGPSIVLALVFNYEFSLSEVLWAFSIYLEAVAIFPQLFMLQRTGEAETITTHYIAALGAYRALYVPNWIYRYWTEGNVDPIAVIAGLVQTGLYLDFFYVYFTRREIRAPGLKPLPTPQHPLTSYSVCGFAVVPGNSTFSYAIKLQRSPLDRGTNTVSCWFYRLAGDLHIDSATPRVWWGYVNYTTAKQGARGPGHIRKQIDGKWSCRSLVTSIVSPKSELENRTLTVPTMVGYLNSSTIASERCRTLYKVHPSLNNDTSDIYSQAFDRWESTDEQQLITDPDAYLAECTQLDAILQQPGAREWSGLEESLVVVDAMVALLNIEPILLPHICATLGGIRNRSRKLVPLNKLPAELVVRILLLVDTDCLASHNYNSFSWDNANYLPRPRSLSRANGCVRL